MHSCVHMWVVHVLNAEWNRNWARLAITAVARHLPDRDIPSYWSVRRHLIHHIAQSWACIYENKGDEEGLEWAMHRFGDAYMAQEMYLRALRGKEIACGSDHTSTLNTVNNLGPSLRWPGQDAGGGGDVSASPGWISGGVGTESLIDAEDCQ